MSKDAKKVEEVKEAQTENALVLTEDSARDLVKNGGVGAALGAMTPQGFSLTAEYLEMEEGEVAKFLVVQRQMMKVADDAGEEKEVEAILMINEEDKTVKAAQTVLVGSMRGVALPAAIQVTCNGNVKLTGGRSYTSFDVLPLS